MGNISPESIVNDLRYLQLLSRSFPTIADASTEIINLEAILNLPKGTEHFLTDIHGEYEAFQHVLKNGSGAVKRKVNEIFGHTLRESEKKELCTLIYYPEEKLQLVKAEEKDLDDWYQITLNQLVKVCQNVSSKYTRSKVRKSLPQEFSYIIQELLHESSIDPNKQAYINVIISTIISTKRADDFIVAMCNLIQRLTIDSLHIVGDIYDRGPGAHIIMDTLCDYHNFDIQWGNHDLLWMGAASGNDACIANVIRLSMRYGNLATLEDGYGINLLPLATFAMDAYADDPCTLFVPKPTFMDGQHNEKTLRLIAQMHKAITVIQFKLAGGCHHRPPAGVRHGGAQAVGQNRLCARCLCLRGQGISFARHVFPHHRPYCPLPTERRGTRHREQNTCFLHEQREVEETHAVPLYLWRHVFGVQ